MTEPHAGSDLERMTTVARRAGNAYVIDGRRRGSRTVWRADRDRARAQRGPRPGLTRFLVPGDAPGLQRETLEPIGLKHLCFVRLIFRGCEIPAELRLGEEGEGLKGAKAAFPIARALAALQSARIAKAAIELAREYAQDRATARSRLASSSLVQHGLAQLSARCEAVRLLALRVANDLQAVDAVSNASAAKALAGELVLDACRFAEDLLGSSSLHVSHPLTALMGDARMMGVVDGTSVLNHLVVGRRMFSGEMSGA